MISIKSLLVAFTLALFVSLPVYAETGFTVLGTQGGPVPNPNRGQPSNLLSVNGVQTLIDVGDGTASRLSKLRLTTDQIDNVLISHLHFDHTGGLQGVIGLRFQNQAQKTMQIYGPPGTEVLVEGIIASMAPAIEANNGAPGKPPLTTDKLVKTHVIKPGDSFNIGDTKVTVAKNTHFGFLLDSPLNKKFQSFSFRFETPDKTIVYTGDTGPSIDVEKLALGADILIGEMIDLELTANQIRTANPHFPENRILGVKKFLARHHLTPNELGKLAAKAGVKELVVTHLVPGGLMTKKHLKQYEEKIALEFSGKITIAEDMDRF